MQVTIHPYNIDILNLILTARKAYVPDNSLLSLKNNINSPFWQMVLDSLGGEKRQGVLHCPPHEGIGREEGADVRK